MVKNVHMHEILCLYMGNGDVDDDDVVDGWVYTREIVMQLS